MKKQGFTLIELLIVVVIIGILVTLITANFVGVRQRGRDAQRKSDLGQIKSALEIYRADIGCYAGSIPTCGQPFTSGTSTYMQKVPCDPLSGGYTYTPSSGSCVPSYTLVACLENTNDSARDATDSCPAVDRVSYTITNP